MRIVNSPTADLFGPLADTRQRTETLAEGAAILRAFATADAPTLMGSLQEILAATPFRHMTTPGGFRMSVAMTNCGAAGWVTDLTGYRYERTDPLSGRTWPPMPQAFMRLATTAAAATGFPGFEPDSCLINRYDPGARLSLHQDRNERSDAAPIVSVSLGLPAVFLFGGAKRKERPRRVLLESGDVVVWGGPSRMAFHGVAALAEGNHPLTGPHRVNLTFRQAL
jgi:alkylated DNA repair protein (DNA oxidative demethylase)